MKIGIDFGTSFSNMSVYDTSENRITVLSAPRIGESYPGVPTVLYHRENEWIIGEDAQRLVESDRLGHVSVSNYISRIKHIIRPQSNIGFDDANYSGTGLTAGEIICTFLERLIRLTIEKANGFSITNPNEIEEITIGCPAACPSHYRETLQNYVYRIVQSVTGKAPQSVNVVAEPTLAALDYFYTNKIKSGNVLVYDIGGGTTDVALVQAKDINGHIKFDEVDRDDGDLQCGGTDFDKALYALLLTETGVSSSEARMMAENASSYDLESIMLFKHILSGFDRTDLVPYNFTQSRSHSPQGLPDVVRTTLQKLENFSTDIFDRAMIPVTRILNKLKKEHPDVAIDYVLMVGGASNMIGIQERLQKTLSEFGIKIKPQLFEGHLSTAISNGGAIFKGDDVEIKLDKTYGINCLIKGKDSNGVDDDETEGISNILLRYSKKHPNVLPTKDTRGYRPHGPRQPSMKIKVYESDSDDVGIDEQSKIIGIRNKTITQLYNQTYEFEVVRVPGISKANERTFNATIALDKNRRLTLTVYDEQLKEDVLRISGKLGDEGGFNQDYRRTVQPGETTYAQDEPLENPPPVIYNLPENLRNMGLSDNASPEGNGRNVRVRGLDKDNRYNIFRVNGRFYAVRLRNGSTTQENAVQVRWGSILRRWKL